MAKTLYDFKHISPIFLYCFLKGLFLQSRPVLVIFSLSFLLVLLGVFLEFSYKLLSKNHQ